MMEARQTVLAIDPGNIYTAFFFLRGDQTIGRFGKVLNSEARTVLKTATYDFLAVEAVASYGMAVGKEVFETCIQIGRLVEAAPVPACLITRLEIKLAICRSPKANDSSIRTALIDAYGMPGTKKSPGKTYGITADCWAALALAETFRTGEFRPYVLAENQLS